MKNKIKVTQPIHPIIGIIFSIVMAIFGLVYNNAFSLLIIAAIVWFLLLICGYFYSCLIWLIAGSLIAGGIGGIVYAYSGDLDNMVRTIAKSASTTIVVIPGLGLSMTYLIRSMESLRMPRPITLMVLITFSFFPVLMKEIKLIRESMKVRGVNNFYNPKIFYKAFFIPLIIRVNDISNTLSLSIETKGFTIEKHPFTSYKTIVLSWKDYFFSISFIATIILGVIYAF
ncbi:MAG: energy-coupling factor transporter transmembrane component T family protein [Mycoplasma sp.]